MEEEKTYEGTITEARNPEKILKISMGVNDEEFAKLMFKINTKVKIIIKEQTQDLKV